MFDILRDIFSSPAGSFGFVAGLIILGGWVIYYVTKFKTTLDVKHESLEKSTAKIIGNIDEIRKDVAFLRGSMEILTKNNDKLTQRNSPISLTEAFKNGYPLMSYTNMLGVLIRDKYFKERGIDIYEIEKYEPQNKATNNPGINPIQGEGKPESPEGGILA